MKVSVFDTYVRKAGGVTANFDVIAPDGTSEELALSFGKAFLASRGWAGRLSSRECRFCHIETPTPEMEAAIRERGYFILELDDIPAELPPHSTRRQLIRHIRANSEIHRFADFSGVGEEKLREIIGQL
jgi:hypothetical protein